MQQNQSIERVQRYQPCLAGIRGYGFLLVFCGHYFIAGQLGHPNTIRLKALTVLSSMALFAVPSFFVLSGYLIGGILYHTRHREGYFRIFYTRRIRLDVPVGHEDEQVLAELLDGALHLASGRRGRRRREQEIEPSFEVGLVDFQRAVEAEFARSIAQARLSRPFMLGAIPAGVDGVLRVADQMGQTDLMSSLGPAHLASQAVAVHPELAEVDPEGLLQYFYFGYIPDPYTAFRRIHKLPAGHLMEYCKGEVKIRRYWDLPDFGTHPAMSEEECLEELESQLEEAVRIRLISDVPLGALLSGGVDSSIIVALMARVSSGAVKTFSIGFHAEQFNESECARRVASVLAPNITNWCSIRI